MTAFLSFTNPTWTPPHPACSIFWRHMQAYHYQIRPWSRYIRMAWQSEDHCPHRAQKWHDIQTRYPHTHEHPLFAEVTRLGPWATIGLITWLNQGSLTKFLDARKTVGAPTSSPYHKLFPSRCPLDSSSIFLFYFIFSPQSFEWGSDESWEPMSSLQSKLNWLALRKSNSKLQVADAIEICDPYRKEVANDRM